MIPVCEQCGQPINVECEEWAISEDNEPIHIDCIELRTGRRQLNEWKTIKTKKTMRLDELIKYVWERDEEWVMSIKN